jgi:two-component system, OmpR family, copper resistance phosphate regulon response regulator CusR
MSNLKLLVVEDEPKIGAFIKEGLEEQGYDVDLVTDGKKGQEKAQNPEYSLLIFDVLLPHVTGIELCRQVRSKNTQIPILMLTALGTTDDKVKGFDSGADDYLVKPFEFQELLVRIKALTRRGSEPVKQSNLLISAGLELDLDSKKAKRENNEINLTAKEFRLLEFLMRNKGRVVSKELIAEKVWDLNFDTGTNFVEVYINLLRKKIDKDYETKLIHTRVGLGYCFTDTP